VKPPVPLGRQKHLLEPGSVPLFDPAPARDLGLRVSEAHGETVADPLKLSHVEYSRSAHGRHSELDPLAGKRCGKELGKPALEGRDLAAQLIAQPALGLACGAKGRQHSGRRRDIERCVGHSGSLSPVG
jgi:hypothetical protein